MLRKSESLGGCWLTSVFLVLGSEMFSRLACFFQCFLVSHSNAVFYPWETHGQKMLLAGVLAFH